MTPHNRSFNGYREKLCQKNPAFPPLILLATLGVVGHGVLCTHRHRVAGTLGLSGGRFHRRHTTGWDRRHGTADRRSHQADSYPADFKSRSRANFSFYQRQDVLKFGFHRKRALTQHISYIYLIRVGAYTYITQIIVHWRHFKTLLLPNLQTQSRVEELKGKLSFGANVAQAKLSDI